MECWKEIVKNDDYLSEYEGIGLNINLSSENIHEILTTSESHDDMYWITEHLQNHPNYIKK